MKFLVPVLFALLLAPPLAAAAPTAPKAPTVPFYSQFRDISSSKWQKVGCGITSLAMLVGYYQQKPVSVDTLLTEGIKAGAYSDAGWSYAGLIGVAKKHGLTGSAYDLGGSSKSAALTSLTKALANGPVIASVHYKLEPTNPIPHLIVVTAIKDGVVYYNDPANKGGQTTASTKIFTAAWKQRYIVIRPAGTKLAFAS
jgi:ABC-type bacteriocin/lantibiotic exporter with double-glycine peptidase domain